LKKVTLGRRFPPRRAATGGKRLPQREGSFINIVLQLYRVVKPIELGEFRFYPGREGLRFQKALAGAAGFVVFPDFLGADLYLADKFCRGHKEVEQGYQAAVDGGKALLEGLPLEAVIADILPAPFFCSTKQLSFFLWSLEREKGMGQRGLGCQPATRWLMNSLPLSLWNSLRGKGRVEWMSLRAEKVQRWALLRRG
jgi:hypothetical protein